MDHEFVARDTCLERHHEDRVYKIFRILVPGNTDNTEALSLSYLVELSVVAPAGQDMVSDDMRNFAGAAETSGSPRENRPQKAHVTKTICPLGLALSCYKKRCYNCPISPLPAMHSSLRMEAMRTQLFLH